MVLQFLQSGLGCFNAFILFTIVSSIKLRIYEQFSPSFVGKNAYAISVLKRVEMKLDGRDIAENRYLLSYESSKSPG